MLRRANGVEIHAQANLIVNFYDLAVLVAKIDLYNGVSASECPRL